MRDATIIGFLRDQENKIIANRKVSFETALDLSVLKELLFEKNIVTKEEYEARINVKMQEFFKRVQEANQPKQENKTEEPAPVLEVPVEAPKEEVKTEA